VVDMDDATTIGWLDDLFVTGYISHLFVVHSHAAFRANASYKRWDEARKNWGSNIVRVPHYRIDRIVRVNIGLRQLTRRLTPSHTHTQESYSRLGSNGQCLLRSQRGVQ
jgi:hypothetical protein